MKSENQTALRFLGEVSGRKKWNILVLILIQALLGISSVCYALALREIINAAVAGMRRQFFISVFFFATLICLQVLLRALNRFLEEFTSSSLENCFKERLLSCLLRKDFASVTAVHSGEWMNRMTSDVEIIANSMVQIFPGLAGMAVKLAGAVGMILLLEPRFLWYIIPGGVLLIGFSYAFRKVMKRMHKKVQEKNGKVRTFLQEALGSLLVVRTFAAEKYTQSEAEKRMQEHRKARLQRSSFSILCNMGFSTAMNGAYVLGAFFCGYGILSGTMSFGNFMAILQLIGQIQSPFANISGFLPRFYNMIASAERLMEAELLPDTPGKEPYSMEKIRNCYLSEFEAIGLKDVSFSYQPPVQTSSSEMPVVLHHLSLEIKKGEYVAFMGPSGCGKSTVLKLFLSLYTPDTGERCLKLGGEQIPLDGSWQKLFAYVPQGNYLMSGTIREIITFSCERKVIDDEKQLQRALQIACADAFVSELEQGADTLLGERGLGLSEGQMQRIAIARAIFSDRPILMLDECTSALDAETEKRLLQNLRTMTDKTVLIVTHRPAALEICDKVIELQKEGVPVEVRKQ